MKKLGIIVILMFIALQNVVAQPLEYHGRDTSFCQKVYKYIRHKTVTSGYVKHSATSGNSRIKLTRKLPYIDAVYIRGGVNLQIIGTCAENKISLKTFYPDIGVKVCNNAVFITNAKSVNCNQSERPCIKLYMHQLRELVNAGNSCINVKNINTDCGLIINNCGGGAICVNGPVQLIQIMNNGSASICVRGVNSEHLHILATRNGNISLTGATHVLLIRAFQRATVDTRFMCSSMAMVQAADEALVTVRTLEDLRAFATGMSNVYYYATPNQLLQHNVLSGNVFQMGGF